MCVCACVCVRVCVCAQTLLRVHDGVALCRRYKAVGKLSGGHQAAVMVLAVDDTDTADGNICVVTGSKDHYIKVRPPNSPDLRVARTCCWLRVSAVAWKLMRFTSLNESSRL